MPLISSFDPRMQGLQLAVNPGFTPQTNQEDPLFGGARQRAMEKRWAYNQAHPDDWNNVQPDINWDTFSQVMQEHMSPKAKVAQGGWGANTVQPAGGINFGYVPGGAQAVQQSAQQLAAGGAAPNWLNIASKPEQQIFGSQTKKALNALKQQGATG
jgi:hypothetical protein